MTRARVLVVDDERNLCRVVSARLEQSGFAVTCAHTGEDALELIPKEDYGVVLLDLRLPAMGGLQVLATLRDMKISVPVIAITATEDHAVMIRALEMGAHACLSKPFDLDSLVESVVLWYHRQRECASSEDVVSWERLSLKESEKVAVTFPQISEQVLQVRVASVDEWTVTLTWPAGEGRITRPAIGAAATVLVSREECLYHAHTRLIARRTGAFPLLILSKPETVERIQRRRHTRCRIEIPVDIAVMENGAVTTQTVSTCDLSFGGVSVLADDRLHSETPVSLVWPQLSNASSRQWEGRVAHTTRYPRRGHRVWLSGIEFRELTLEQQKGLDELVQSNLA